MFLKKNIKSTTICSRLRSNHLTFHGTENGIQLFSRLLDGFDEATEIKLSTRHVILSKQLEQIESIKIDHDVIFESI